MKLGEWRVTVHRSGIALIIFCSVGIWLAGKCSRSSWMHMNLQLSGLSDVSKSPNVVFSKSKKDSFGSLPNEVLRFLRMKGLKARSSVANAKG